MIDHYALSALLTSVSVFCLGFFSFYRRQEDQAASRFFLLSFAIAFWSFGLFMHAISNDKNIVIFWGRFLHIGAIFIPVFLYNFSVILTEKNYARKYVLRSIYVLALVQLFLLLTPLFISDALPKHGYQYWVEPGILYPFHVVVTLAIILSSIGEILVGFASAKDSNKRNQLGYYLLAVLIGYGFAGANYLLNYNIQIYFISPYINYAILFYVALTTYAITRYRLMDIEVIFRKGIIYSILSVVLTTVYFAVVYISKIVFYSITGANTLWFIVPAVFVLSLFIHPLFAYVQDFVDKRFFKTKYEADKIAKKFSEGIKKLMKAKDLAEYINRVAFRTFKLKGSAVYIFDEEEALYKCYDSRGTMSGICSKDITSDDPIVLCMSKARGIVISGDKDCSNIEDEMKSKHVSICVPALSRKKDYQISGFLIADEKKSEDPFSQQDKMLLETIANQAVMSIDNAVLYMARIDARKKTLLVKRLNELGSSAAAVAHQTRVAMSPVIDFATQFQEKWGDRNFVEGALSKFPFDVERLRLILTGILEYSRELRLGSVEELDLKQTANSVAGLISGRAKEKNVSVEVDIPDSLKVKAERSRLRDVLIYLAINSLEAMPFGGQIRILASADQEKTHIKFSDNGSGIDPDVLPKVFTPFFSGKKGSIGLGLSIVKKIIEGHGGSVSIESQRGKGTTVSLELPA